MNCFQRHISPVLNADLVLAGAYQNINISCIHNLSYWQKECSTYTLFSTHSLPFHGDQRDELTPEDELTPDQIFSAPGGGGVSILIFMYLNRRDGNVGLQLY